MHLWNDYEGATLAGQWTLGKLLRTEGRSALFATTRGDGGPAVLRLTEALNDQTVLAARYRAIQAAGDTYLVTLEGFGEAELDGAPLSYAVLEPTQESLADIVAVRPLSPDEVYEVATAAAGGLLALHGQGLVHGLVEPESVLAAGERIKLRSDCARPAPAPEDATLEGAVTPQTDAFGLAGVIYRALTQQRLHGPADALALPEPFATIVRNAARGSWGVAEMQAELVRYHRTHAPVVPAVAPQSPRLSPSAVPESRNATRAVTDTETLQPAAGKAAAAASGPIGSDISAKAAEPWQQPERVPPEKRRGILIGVGAVVLVLLLFSAFHHSAAPHAKPSSPPQPTAGPAVAATMPAPAAQSSVPKPSTQAAPQASSGPVPGQKVWRVIAYTYDRQGEAAAKAAALNTRFPGFNAQAWSRTGQRPFLVTLGGAMSKEQAFTLRARARSAGVAHDVYAQNYTR